VVRGAADGIASAAEAQAMADALGVPVHTVEDAGHLTPLEAPREVATAISQVLAAAEAVRA
jgi:pimeloyl-ACP methyl ester carboxylesterase